LCVSPDYNSTTLGGKEVTSTSEICKEYRSVFNHCYNGAYVDGKFVSEKRKNATELENTQRFGCVQYQCQNDTGELKMTLMCEEKECYSDGKCNEVSGVCEYKRNGGYEELMKEDNHCYEVLCEGNKWIVKKRNNATEWESRTKGCVDYTCDNNTGGIVKSLCNDGNEICVNDKCVEKASITDNWIVEIDVYETSIEELNTTQIISDISDLAEVNADVMKIGIEFNEKGYIVRILVYVGDEMTANKIATAIRGLDKGEGCSRGILCRAYDVRVTCNQILFVSGGLEVRMNVMLLFLAFSVLVLFSQ